MSVRAKTKTAVSPAAAPAASARNVIRIPKIAEVVAGHIRKMIIRGEVREGDFLQPEAALMEHFGTSRPTIAKRSESSRTSS